MPTKYSMCSLAVCPVHHIAVQFFRKRRNFICESKYHIPSDMEKSTLVRYQFLAEQFLLSCSRHGKRHSGLTKTFNSN